MSERQKRTIDILTDGLPVRQFDSHLHLQDARLKPYLDDVIAKALASGLRGCRTCGTSPSDWADVAALARRAQDNVQFTMCNVQFHDAPSPQRGEPQDNVQCAMCNVQFHDAPSPQRGEPQDNVQCAMCNVQFHDAPSPQRGEPPRLRSAAVAGRHALPSPVDCMPPTTTTNNYDSNSAFRLPPSDFSFQILPAFGVHPWYVEKLPDDWEEQLEKYLTDFPDVPVGEIGLDGLHPSPSAEIQKKIFIAQLELAAKLKRPVILHGARVWNELYETFKPFADKIPIVQLHAFSGSPEQMRDWLKTGAVFSVGGGICNPKSTRLRNTVLQIPKDRLLFETDSPDMFPNGGTSASPDTLLNQPSNLTCIISAYEFVS